MRATSTCSDPGANGGGGKSAVEQIAAVKLAAEESTDGKSAVDDGDWFAIRTDPWPCPACGQEFEYVTGAHFVIVTPSADDLLAIAQRCKEVGRNPRIVPYEDDLPTMTLFAWHAHGRPVHGIKKV